MSWLPLLLAAEPDWAGVAAAFPFAAEMAACPQDPVFHAEGDVWIHTRSVVEALRAQPGFTALPDERRDALLLAAWFHDVGKARTTLVEWDSMLRRERIRQPGHARLGARMAWRTLWREGVPRPMRERVYWLCAWHQRPFHMWTSKSMLRDAIAFAEVGRWRDLLMLARADATGRIAPDIEGTLESLDLLELWLDEHKLLSDPWPFANPESRLAFLLKADRSPHYAAPRAGGAAVAILSGLPGSGKDTYAASFFPDLPMISLDQIRRERRVDPEEAQGEIIQAANEEARKLLRKRTSFVWNATNVTRAIRERVIKLCLDYDAYVVIHAIDRSLETILRQNADRQAAVPAAVVQRLAEKLEPPSVLEAHEVRWT